MGADGGGGGDGGGGDGGGEGGGGEGGGGDGDGGDGGGGDGGGGGGGGDVALLCAEATESAPEGEVHEPADWALAWEQEGLPRANLPRQICSFFDEDFARGPNPDPDPNPNPIPTPIPVPNLNPNPHPHPNSNLNPRPNPNQDFARGPHAALFREASIVVGMHPDQATEPIVRAALRAGKPFAVVPCCVFKTHNTHRRLRDGSKVRTTEDPSPNP